MTDEPLAMNPFVDIHVHPAPESVPIDISRIETITVRCPVRGRGLLIRDLTPAADPALFAFFASVVAREGELELDSDAPLVPELVRIGFLVADEEVVDWPRFEVPLEGVADGAASSGAHAVDDARWIVSPTFCFQPAFALHPRIAWPRDYNEQEGRLRCFAPGPAIWVGDPDELAAPHWVSDDWAAMLAKLRPGAAPPPLPAPLARALVRIGALVPANRPAPAPFARFADHRAAYEADGVVVARDLLGADETAALRRYYASLLAAGLVPFGDRQNAARFSTYNDPVGRFVHARLAGAMSAIAGQPVVPSFSYFFSYLEGAALASHKDRPQAEFSISLQIDHTPAPVGAIGWPLRFTFDDGRMMAADLAIGDAVLYHGRAVTHHRAPLPLGQHSSILVLEYVPHDFRGLLI
ncbi:MAG TPA: hypothetical protein VLM79_00445 [Kofleriaceae bacterium]|nr:hypothetical protein [Kofleriaceae bacterium]